MTLNFVIIYFGPFGVKNNYTQFSAITGFLMLLVLRTWPKIHGECLKFGEVPLQKGALIKRCQTTLLLL